MVTSNAVALLRSRTIYETGQLDLHDNETQTATLEGNRQYLYINMHAIYGGEIQLITCFNGNLKKTKVCTGRTLDTTITNNGQDVTFTATRECRGHLFKVTEYTTT